MQAAGTGVHGARVRGLVIVLWRAGLRTSETFSLAERDLDPGRRRDFRPYGGDHAVRAPTMPASAGLLM